MLVLRDAVAVSVPIQIGSSDERNTQVLAGLELGDEVVVGQSTTGTTSGGQRSILPGPGAKPGGGGTGKPGGGGNTPKPGGG